MSENTKTFLTIALIIGGGYLAYRFFYGQNTLENPDTGTNVGGDDNSKIVYPKEGRQVQVKQV